MPTFASSSTPTRCSPSTWRDLPNASPPDPAVPDRNRPHCGTCGPIRTVPAWALVTVLDSRVVPTCAGSRPGAGCTA